MRPLLRLLPALLLACGDAPVERAQRPIVNGTPDTGDPAVVGLLGYGSIFCTGTLVHPRVVVTAAHCIDTRIGGVNATSVEIFFGNDENGEGQTIDVLRGKRHPDWEKETLANDIAVLTLEADAPTAPLPMLTTPLDASFVGMTTRLVGFGVTSGDGEDSGLKRETTSTITDFDATTLTYSTDPGQTCYGDSGGPAFVTLDGVEYLVGVTSTGDEACAVFGVNTRVDAFVADFIQPVIDCLPGNGCRLGCPQVDPDCETCGGGDACVSDCEPRDPDCPGAAEGEACVADDDCDTGLCIAATDDPTLLYCSKICDDLGCPPRMECVATSGGDLEVCAYPPPTPGATGASCAAAADCASGLCVSAGTEKLCSRTCAAAGGGDCPLGYACAERDDAFLCLPAPAGEGWCAVGRRPPPLAAALLLLLLGAARRRRAR